MTPEQITKMAEEYAKELFPKHYPLMQRGECDLEEEEIIKGCISAFESHIRYLMQNYYIVEKGRVEAHYQSLKRDKPNYYVNPQTHCGMVGAMTELESLFGPDIRKEEEE